MDTENNINDDILFLAEKLSYNNNLLIKQSENWLSEEAGNRNMEKRIEERRKKVDVATVRRTKYE